MALARNVARNLKFTRLSRNLSQRQVAKRAGFSISMISMLERGQRTPPLSTLEALAKALRTHPLDLLKS